MKQKNVKIYKNKKIIFLKYLLGSIFSALESKLQEIYINIYMLSMQKRKDVNRKLRRKW